MNVDNLHYSAPTPSVGVLGLLSRHRGFFRTVLALQFLVWFVVIALLSVQKALPLFQDSGSIILMASIGGSKGVEGLRVYHATKTAIRSFARSWTVDLKQWKIRVNSISPGPIDTPGLRHALQSLQDPEKLMTAYLNTIPLGRFGNPDDIASAVSFLVSNDSSFVTGIELCVDGGMAQYEGTTRMRKQCQIRSAMKPKSLTEMKRSMPSLMIATRKTDADKPD